MESDLRKAVYDVLERVLCPLCLSACAMNSPRYSSCASLSWYEQPHLLLFSIVLHYFILHYRPASSPVCHVIGCTLGKFPECPAGPRHTGDPPTFSQLDSSGLHL